jgi:hypothetical protein
MKLFYQKLLIDLFNHTISHYHPNDRYVSFCKGLLNIGIYSELYQKIKQFYGGEFNSLFADYMAEHPYLGSAAKYNI